MCPALGHTRDEKAPGTFTLEAVSWQPPADNVCLTR